MLLWCDVEQVRRRYYEWLPGRNRAGVLCARAGPDFDPNAIRRAVTARGDRAWLSRDAFGGGFA
jgi:hypothetical protein